MTGDVSVVLPRITAHISVQIIEGERFAQESNTRVERGIVDDGVPRVAGHVQHGEIRAHLHQRICKFAPVLVRHDDIGQQNGNARIFGETLAGDGSRIRFERLVTPLLNASWKGGN